MARPYYKLREITLPGTEGRIHTGKYRAITTRRGVRDKEWIVREMLDRFGLRIPPEVVMSVVDATLDTMARITLDEGATCQWGDYFATRLDVRGVFEERDEAFDPRKHEVRLTLRAGKRLLEAARRKGGEAGNRARNEVAAPRAKIACVASAGSSIADEIRIGRDIELTGENLELLADGDYLELLVAQPSGVEQGFTFALGAGILVNHGERLAVEWPPGLTDEVAAAAGHKARFVLWSSGGKSGAKRRMARYRNEVAILPRAG